MGKTLLLSLLLGVCLSLPAWGQSGNCIRFDGSNDHLRVNHNSDLNISATWTIEFWLNPDVTPSGWDALVSKSINNRPPSVWLYYNSVEVWYGSGTNGLIAYSNFGTISAGEWQHVAATRGSSGTVRIYINGELESTVNSTSTPPTNSERLYMAQRGDGVYYYDGYMDDIRYWNVERTQAQIRENMCKKLAGTETGLVCNWELDETSGNTATDDVSSRNASLRNSPTRATSGAPIGSNASYLFTNSWTGQSLYHTSTDGDSIRVSNVTGSPDGMVLYSVDASPNSTSGTAGLGGNDHYFGVFKANGTSPTYTLTYYYGSNSAYNASASGIDNDLRLYQRARNDVTSWTSTSMTLNTGDKTLTATGLNSEFIMGSSNNPLPVDLLKFEGKKSPNGNELYWVTASETNSDYFVIERSTDGRNWNYLLSEDAAGTTSEVTKYHVTDLNPLENTYYRLTQYDFDGSMERHSVILVNNSSPNSDFRHFQVYPSAALDHIRMKTNESGSVEIRTISGKLVYANSIENEELNVDVSNYSEGTYIATFINQNEQSRTLRFVKLAE